MSRFRLGETPNLAAAPIERHAVERSQIAAQEIRADIQAAIIAALYERIKPDAVVHIERRSLIDQIEIAIAAIADERKLQISHEQQRALAQLVGDDMRGIGPLQPLMSDETITDIIVIGPDRVFVERMGRLYLSDIRFRDEDHVRQIANRIARQIGRKVDESNPMVDARLKDGSRVNIVIPPIALDGTLISIRRFPNQAIDLDALVRGQAISPAMKTFLEVAAKCRLNIVVSGGTSSGKTTLLNAMSQYIGAAESIVTIEDSAELRLKQVNVRRLETRPSQGEGSREVTQRELVKNALRMRPDRIILGEVRSGEAFDMLQAMNTGHEGSMSTLHANSTRDALARLESMILMAGLDLPARAIRAQIASAINIIIQIERMTDGVRRVTKISEVTGVEGDVIAMQELFEFEVDDVKAGTIIGRHKTHGASLACMEKTKRFGMQSVVRSIFAGGGQ